MDNPPERPSTARIRIHPAMTPERLPGFDMGLLSGEEFRLLIKQVTDYREVWEPKSGLQYHLRGIFQAQGGRNNKCFLKVAIEEVNGEEQASIHLTAESCIRLARHLLQFGVSLANINGTPETVGTALVELLEELLHPKDFAILKNSLMAAMEEELKGKVAVHGIAGKTQKG